ncbi:hypothetical protein A9P82_03180 [Arachidicoccus ginsenosidimutans]|uniref:alpha/beta hydrolase n=1 Tax=Arachidicoccus sp. BS20 TaxID=1850526 RepID=UPI0007F055CA|nr:alpha/beta hydrolase [Arachidicoccus sp. BS20]ANI88389.1 hypothetical protein A9P82_03180 [Arachidicoccus sp. BS20]
MKKCVLLIIVIFLFHRFSMAQEIIPLYNKVPNSKPSATYREKADTGTDGIIRISKVSVPTITVFHPDKNIDQHTAIIICPGGGYTILAFNWEGTSIAETLVKWGITAIVLKYRLPSDDIMTDKTIGPLQDAERAIQLVRMNAKKWNIDSSKIGIMGFSAGGNLAANLSTLYNDMVIDNPQHISLRPDFSVLGYPVISMDKKITHMGSHDALLGKNSSIILEQKFSNELNVTENTPPAFLFLANDDNVVNPLNSIDYYEALLKNHVPAELHIYQNGGHGFGQDFQRINGNWTDRLKLWLQHNHYLSTKN